MTYTCSVTGFSLVWGYPGISAVVFTSTFNTTRQLGRHIEVEFVSSNDTVIQSRAKVNVTSDIHGKALHCRNDTTIPGSVRKNVTFNVQGNCLVS